MREVVIDSEWTGLQPEEDYIIEICCLELVDRRLTGGKFHSYFLPPINLSKLALEATGINDDFLQDKPKFADIADELIDFIGTERMVMNLASLELDFLNAELGRLGKSDPLTNETFDVVHLLRQKFPELPAALEKVSKRYGLEPSEDLVVGPGCCEAHAWLTANVYLQLCKEFDLA